MPNEQEGSVSVLDGPMQSGVDAVERRQAHHVQGIADGLHLANSILSFDAFDSGLLSFVSSCWTAYRKQFIKPQIIASEETFRLLGLHGKTQSPLVCQYNRPFSIGHLKMELLPSGTVLGGASLHVENQDGRLLYAPALQPFNTGIVRRMQIKKAETLILRAAVPPDRKLGASRGKERERLLQLVDQALSKGQSPIIIAEPFAIAPEIIKYLSEQNIPLRIHSAIAKILNQYKELHLSDGMVTRFHRRHRLERPLIVPDYLASRFLMTCRTRQDHPCLWVHSYSGEYPWEFSRQGQEKKTETEDSVFLSFGSDLHDLKDVIKIVQPDLVYFMGPYTKKYAEECQDLAPAVEPIYQDQQPPLF